jgi:hypothetical protein
VHDQAAPPEDAREVALRERGWTRTVQGWWVSPHIEDGIAGKRFTFEGSCAREGIKYRDMSVPSYESSDSAIERELQGHGLGPNLEPLRSRPTRKPPPGITPGTIYDAEHGLFRWSYRDGFERVLPSDTEPESWPEEAEEFRPAAPVPVLPPAPEELPVPEGEWLRLRYDPLTNVRTVDESFLSDTFAGSDDGEAGYREAIIPNVYAGGSLAILGSKKNTTSIQCQELAATLTTCSEHWGLPEFIPRCEPKRVLLVQEENEHAAVMQDFEHIFRARGLPPDTLDTLLREGRLRVLSRRRMNLMNDAHRALIAGMCEGVLGRQGFDVLILDRVDKMGVTDVTNAAGELQAFLNWLTAIQVALDTDPIFSWPRISNAKAFTFDTCLGGETIPRWWQGGMLVQRRDPCRVDVRIDMLRHRLGEHRYKLEGVSAVGEVGEWALRDVIEHGEQPKREITVKRGKALAKFRALLRAKPEISNAEAASELGVSEKTISRYRKARAE